MPMDVLVDSHRQMPIHMQATDRWDACTILW